MTKGEADETKGKANERARRLRTVGRVAVFILGS